MEVRLRPSREKCQSLPVNGSHLNDYKSSGPCLCNPCLNGGTCEDYGGNGFVCQCPKPYTGSLCETGLGVGSGPCLCNPCLNGGTCEDYGDKSFMCQCPKLYTGTFCQAVLD
ncbi:vitamin K-dependent protein Z-like [Glandiceps talaboti]